MTADKSLMFGQEIRKRRRAKDIVQAHLANHVGCKVNVVTELERRCVGKGARVDYR